MRSAEVVCVVVSAVAQVVGIGLLVREGRQARRIYVRYLETTRLPGDAVMRKFMERSVQSSHYRLDAAEQVVDHLLGSRARWGLAASLLVVGVVAGTVGSVLGL